jgi:hypothetical protein
LIPFLTSSIQQPRSPYRQRQSETPLVASPVDVLYQLVSIFHLIPRAKPLRSISHAFDLRDALQDTIVREASFAEFRAALTQYRMQLH